METIYCGGVRGNHCTYYPVTGQAGTPDATALRHRIALVITDLEPGGAERQMVELAVRMPHGEFQPSVIVLAPPPPHTQLVERLHAAGIPLTFLGARRKWKIRAVVRGLADHLRQELPALVQSFLYHANVVGAVAAKRAGVKRVVTGLRVAERRIGIRRWLERATDRYVARHVCVSRAVHQYAARVVGLPAEKLVTIPNGVNVRRFSQAKPLSPAELGRPDGAKIVAYLGRLDRQKRLGWLLRRWPEITGRQTQAHLVLAGEGPQRERLQQLAARLGVATHVHFSGWRPDVPRILAAADLVVLTSAWEGMPNAILEAMAAARPVVATEAEGIAEILGPLASEPARQLVPADDAAAFVEAVLRLLGDESLASSAGLANRRRVEEAFTIERMVERYCELYRQLLDE